MAQVPSKEDVLKQYREDGITDATRRVIAQEGFAALTIERVAELANISKGTIYLYFKNKDDLIQATVTDTFRQIIARLSVAQPPELPFPERLRALIRLQLQQFETNQAFFRALMADRRYLPQADNQEDCTVQLHLQLLSIFADVIREGQAGGFVRPEVDPDEAAFFLFQLISGSSMRHLLGFSNRTLGESVEVLLTYLFSGISTRGV